MVQDGAADPEKGAIASVDDVGASVSKAPANQSPLAKLPVPALIALSIVSSVSLIIVNKLVMHDYHFNYVLVLTTFHFICTSAAMHILAAARVFEAATHVPRNGALKMAGAGAASIVFMNLSLRFNSVGTYQMLKLAVIPCAMVLACHLEGARYSAKRIASLVVLLAGVGIATVTDVQLSMVGLVLGAIAVFSTALAQTWMKTKQKEFGVDPMQMLHAVAPWQALVTGVPALVLETDVLTHSFRDTEILLILISGVIAVSVNLASMGLIGRTSPVVYQVRNSVCGR